MSWSEYVKRVMGTDTQKQAEEKTSVSQGTISKWLSGNATHMRAVEVVKFADGYRDKTTRVEAVLEASALTDKEVAEVLNRLRPRARRTAVRIQRRAAPGEERERSGP